MGNTIQNILFIGIVYIVFILILLILFKISRYGIIYDLIIILLSPIVLFYCGIRILKIKQYKIFNFNKILAILFIIIGIFYTSFTLFCHWHSDI